MGRVALEVRGEEVHITGEQGAIASGGSAVEITNLTTGMVTKATAKADGSFDVHVDGSPDDAFAVKASSNGKSSANVYVVRGNAVVGKGNGGTLSCEQRDQLAGFVLERALSEADTSCTADSDCQAFLQAVQCLSNCNEIVVSQAGLRTLGAALGPANQGLCNGFAQAGCPNPDRNCPEPKPAACVDGRCVVSDTSSNQLSCQQRTQLARDMISVAEETADARCMVDNDCTFTGMVSTCTGPGCGPGVIVSQTGAASIAAVITGIDDGLCASFLKDGCITPGPSPCPHNPFQTSVPACMNGRCIERFVPIDAGAPDASAPDAGISDAGI